MRKEDILIKPLLTEKANDLSEKAERYTFVVARGANKLEIKEAVEAFYGVEVDQVRTMVVPGKRKSRYTKRGVLSGIKPAYKKAIVTLTEGDTIDIFESI